jgi:diguanylate cyclase (GGDEF)-like protein
MQIVTLEKSDPIFDQIAATLETAGYKSVQRIKCADIEFDAALSRLFPGNQKDFPVYILDSDLYLDHNIHLLLSEHRTAFRSRAVVLLVAPEDSLNNLERFPFGVHEIIFKPLSRVDLLARLQSSIRWKRENDRLLKMEHELINLTTKSKRDVRSDAGNAIAERDFFEAYYELEWRRSEEDKSLLCLLAIKPDLVPNVKPGHVPEIINGISEILSENLRRPEDYVAKYHEDEFIAVVSIKDFEGAKTVSEKMRSSVAGRLLTISGISYLLSISIGASVVNPSTSTNRSDALLVAVEAMNQSARNGGNQVTFTDIETL